MRDKNSQNPRLYNDQPNDKIIRKEKKKIKENKRKWFRSPKGNNFFKSDETMTSRKGDFFPFFSSFSFVGQTTKDPFTTDDICSPLRRIDKWFRIRSEIPFIYRRKPRQNKNESVQRINLCPCLVIKTSSSKKRSAVWHYCYGALLSWCIVIHNSSCRLSKRQRCKG